MPGIHDSYPGSSGIAARSRHDDRSGLIDIRTLSSLVDQQRASASPSASISSVALPSFGATPWTLQEVRTPAPQPAAVRPRPNAAPVENNRPLYIMIAALSVALLGLGALVAFKPPRTVVVETPVPAAAVVPSVDDAAEAAAAEAPEAEAQVVATETPEPAAAAEAEATPPEAVAEATPSRARDRSRSASRRAAKPPREAADARDAGTVPVACVIDPSSCGRGSSGPTKDQPTPITGLPASPSNSQVRSAMAAVKPQAKACGSKHGAKSGDNVRVKLSVTGHDGHITSARAIEEHADTALGRCVAEALSKATLPRFSKPQAGLVYAIRM